MGDAPFIKFYPSDFLAGTSGMSPAERGVYITLLCLIYEADGPIAFDETRLARRCGAPRNVFSRLLEALVMDGKLTLEDGFLSNRRAEKALADRHLRIKNSTMAASKKWKRDKQKDQGKQWGNPAGASATQCAGNAIPEPEPDNISSNDDIGASASAHAQKLTPRQELETVLDEERADAVIEHRQRMRKPLTARAAKMLAGKLSKAGDPNRAADLMIERGWAGFEVDWTRRTFCNDPPSKAKPNIWDDAFGLSGPLTIDADPLP
jgi:uncharacterized protein YdaU (DUF1376 family)